MPVKNKGPFRNLLAGILPYRLKHFYNVQLKQRFDYHIAKRLNLYIRKRQPIIIYQMGKVGSKSIEYSLKNSGHFVFHTHSLATDDLLANIKKGDQYAPNRHWLWIHDTIVKSDREAKYITLVRDPVAVDVAGFFQNLDRFTGIKNSYLTLTVDELLERFLTPGRLESQYPLRWFDRQIKPVLDIDVYQHPFSQNKGYTTISKGSADLLILKTELDDAIKEKAVTEFLDLDGFTLERSNVGSDKGYSNLYKAFKKRLVLPQEYLDLYYDSKHTRHFYSPEEIEQMRAQWQSK